MPGGYYKRAGLNEDWGVALGAPASWQDGVAVGDTGISWCYGVEAECFCNKAKLLA